MSCPGAVVTEPVRERELTAFQSVKERASSAGTLPVQTPGNEWGIRVSDVARWCRDPWETVLAVRKGEAGEDVLASLLQAAKREGSIRFCDPPSPLVLLPPGVCFWRVFDSRSL